MTACESLRMSYNLQGRDPDVIKIVKPVKNSLGDWVKKASTTMEKAMADNFIGPLYLALIPFIVSCENAATPKEKRERSKTISKIMLSGKIYEGSIVAFNATLSSWGTVESGINKCLKELNEIEGKLKADKKNEYKKLKTITQKLDFLQNCGDANIQKSAEEVHQKFKETHGTRGAGNRPLLPMGLEEFINESPEYARNLKNLQKNIEDNFAPALLNMQIDLKKIKDQKDSMLNTLKDITGKIKFNKRNEITEKKKTEARKKIFKLLTEYENERKKYLKNKKNCIEVVRKYGEKLNSKIESSLVKVDAPAFTNYVNVVITNYENHLEGAKTQAQDKQSELHTQMNFKAYFKTFSKKMEPMKRKVGVLMNIAES